MKRLLRWLKRKFHRGDVVHFITRMPVGFELSDGDKARLYGWPDKYVSEVEDAASDRDKA